MLFVMIECDFVSKTTCLSFVLSQVESKKLRLESVFLLSFVNERFLANTVLLLQNPVGVQWCETQCMSGFTTFSPSCDESCIQYGCQIE